MDHLVARMANGERPTDNADTDFVLVGPLGTGLGQPGLVLGRVADKRIRPGLGVGAHTLVDLQHVLRRNWQNKGENEMSQRRAGLVALLPHALPLRGGGGKRGGGVVNGFQSIRKSVSTGIGRFSRMTTHGNNQENQQQLINQPNLHEPVAVKVPQDFKVQNV